MAYSNRNVGGSIRYRNRRYGFRGHQPTHDVIVQPHPARTDDAPGPDYDRASELVPTPTAGPSSQAHGTLTPSGQPHRSRRHRQRTAPYTLNSYALSVGRHPSRFCTLRPDSSGRGLVVIMVNHSELIPGLEIDIQTLVETYTHKLNATYVLIGDPNDPNVAARQNVTNEAIADIFRRVNEMYNRGTRLDGTEFDRIMFHLFAPGNDQFVCLRDGIERQVNLVSLLANEMSNLEGQIPVVLFTHISAPPADLPLPPTGSDSVPLHSSRNLLGVFTKQGQVNDYDPHRSGSWMVQNLMRSMAETGELLQAVALTNSHAMRQNHPELLSADNRFKQLYL